MAALGPGIDGAEPTAEAAEGAALSVDGLPAVVFEKIVVKVDTVERRIRRVDLVKVSEVLVNEVWQGFG